MALPERLILRAVEIEQQRRAESALERLQLSAIADGTEQGRRYVRGKNDPTPTGDEGYYSTEPYQRAVELLERQARPWLYTIDKLIARRLKEEEEDFLRLEQLMESLC